MTDTDEEREQVTGRKRKTAKKTQKENWVRKSIHLCEVAVQASTRLHFLQIRVLTEKLRLCALSHLESSVLKKL